MARCIYLAVVAAAGLALIAVLAKGLWPVYQGLQVLLKALGGAG